MQSRSRLARLPPWISHWLGYRRNPSAPSPSYVTYLWSFIGSFCGLSLLQGLFGYSAYFIDRDVVPIVASYGASAVLCYGVIESPLAQPRALIGGHFISALLGLCITKLFGLLPTQARFDSLRWLAGSLSASVAIVAMQFTKTTHPPAGATALLAAVNTQVYAMSWYYLPVVLLSSTLVLVTALLVNNIQRRYPVFWFEPASPAVQATPPKSSAISTPSSAAGEDGVELASSA